MRTIVRPSRGIYLTHVDRDLGLSSVSRTPLGHDELHALLVLYSLLYDHLVIPDGASFYNLLLRDVMQGPTRRPYGLAKLLEHGIVVPVARDVAPSFVELEAFLHASGAWHSPDRDDARQWAEFLDEHTRTRVLLHHPSAGETFSDLVYEVTRDSRMADRLMLGGVRDDLSRFLAERELQYVDRFTRRSTLYEFADRLPHSEATTARRTRILGGALYHLTAASALGLPCAMAGPFADAFGALNGLPVHVRQVVTDSRDMSPAAVHAVPFDPLAFASIDFEVVFDIRRSRQFRTFVDAMAAAKSDANSVRGAATASAALAAYLGYLDEPLTIAVAGRHSEVRRLRRAATATSFTLTSAGIATSVAGLFLPGAESLTFGGGLFWLFGEKAVGRYLDQRLSGSIASARADVLAARGDDDASDGLSSLALASPSES
jgi:hypothetical protein